MKLQHISEAFALTVLDAAIQRNGGATGKELKDIVAGAVQVCIDADRAVYDYLTEGASGRTRRDPSQGL